MGRRLSQVTALDRIPLILPIELGGTGGNSEEAAHISLDTASAKNVGQVGHAAALDAQGWALNKNIPPSYGYSRPNVFYNNISRGSVNQLKIVNADLRCNYVVTAEYGQIFTTDFSYEENPFLYVDYLPPSDTNITSDTIYVNGVACIVRLGSGGGGPPPAA